MFLPPRRRSTGLFALPRAPMAPTDGGFDKVPTELIAKIVDVVEAEDRRSLHSLIVVNRHFHSIVSRVLCTGLTINVQNRSSLETNIIDCIRRLLKHPDIGAYVQTLYITGRGPMEDLCFEPAHRPSVRTDTFNHVDLIDARMRTGQWRFANKDTQGLTITDPHPVVVTQNPATDDDLTAFNMDSHWGLLPDLIQPHLVNLIRVAFDCSTQVPPCLLNALELELPECKLEITRLHLRSLLENPLKTLTLNPYEMRLVTSPALTHIGAMITAPKDTWHESDLEALQRVRRVASRQINQMVALMRIVAGGATNVRSVHVECNIKDEWESPLPSLDLVRSDNGQPIPFVKAALSELSLVGSFGVVNTGLIEAWAMHTNFSKLRRLRLASPTLGALRYLLDRVERGRLKQLQELDLDLAVTFADPAYGPQYDLEAEMLVRGLPQLERLKLKNWPFSKSVPIANWWNLTSLHLSTLETQFFEASQLCVLVDLCPNLEEVHLKVRRVLGNHDMEENTYKIGHFLPKLRRLSLDIVTPLSHENLCSWTKTCKYQGFWQEPTNHFGFAEPYRKGHFRDMLINAAIDRQWAANLFKVVSAAPKQFERLQVNVEGFDIPYQNLILRSGVPGLAFEAFVNYLRATFVVTRNPRDDGLGGDIVVKETVPRTRADSAALFDHHWHSPDAAVFREIFRKLWPGRNELSDPKKDWFSFPICMTDALLTGLELKDEWHFLFKIAADVETEEYVARAPRLKRKGRALWGIDDMSPAVE